MGSAQPSTAGHLAHRPAPVGAVHERVRANARSRPDGIALRRAGRSLTYGELEARATALAGHLAGAGIGSGATVAVCLARSFGTVVACLGALKAGCAFLLLDPADPVARRDAILDDAGAAILICDRRHAGDHGAAGLLLVDEEGLAAGAGAAPVPGEIDTAPTDPGQLAYVVYTSGSTGTPKGVEITHANLVHLVDWHNRQFGITVDDRASHLAGLGFDASVWEVWPYLAAGASVEIVDDTVRTSPELLRDWLVAQGITVAFVPTALAEPMIAHAWPAATPLRLMLTGGDRLRAHPRRGLPFALVNNYGPCECTVVATSGTVPALDAGRDPGGPPSIGVPIAGARVYILDEAGEPVPAAIEGEIWIGGGGVGRGYRNRPALTASSFVPDPFGERPDGMIYRTGDRGLCLPTGEIVFRGRTDRQVKVRGVRIELDEIASALQRHPAIASTVVVAREDERAGTQLVAYYVTAPAAGGSDGAPPAPDAEELRAHLAAALPAAAVPSHFVRVEAMPLTRNGKLDADALPQVDPAASGDAAGRPPETATEIRLAAIIAQVLGVAELAATGDFFLLGGHSLLATQVVIQSREAFDVELSLRDLFEAPTVEGLARTIEQRLADKVGALSEDEVLAMLAVEAF